MTKVCSHTTWTLFPYWLRSLSRWRHHLSGSSPVLFSYRGNRFKKVRVKGQVSKIRQACI